MKSKYTNAKELKKKKKERNSLNLKIVQVQYHTSF